jgi:hypothetical protein
MKIATVCTGIGSPDLAADRLGWEHVRSYAVEVYIAQRVHR